MNDIIEVENCQKFLLFHTLCVAPRRLIGVVAKSRKEHLIAQTHELACTKELLPQVIATGMYIHVQVLCRMCYECLWGWCVELYGCV